MRSRILCAAVGIAVLSAGRAFAEFPYPSCGGCPDPTDYQAYMFNPTTSPPALPNEVGPYDFRASSLVDPTLPDTPEELDGVAGMSIDTAWQLTTGRPDVVVAHLDSGHPLRQRQRATRPRSTRASCRCPKAARLRQQRRRRLQHRRLRDRLARQRSRRQRHPRPARPDPGVQRRRRRRRQRLRRRHLRLGHARARQRSVRRRRLRSRHRRSRRASSGEVNNGGAWGVAPNAMFVPIKVSDSFVADGNDFGAGVAYALDRGVSVISEALGALNNTPLAQDAVEYACRSGVPMVLSAADEQSYHHNFPAVYTHGFWANSVRRKTARWSPTRPTCCSTAAPTSAAAPTSRSRRTRARRRPPAARRASSR